MPLPNTSGKIYMTFYMSSNSPSSGRGFPNALVASGWYLYATGFMAGVVRSVNPDNVIIHNPFGYAGAGSFSFNQYLECRQHPVVSSVANAHQFASGISVLHTILGAKPYCYIGVPQNEVYSYDIFKYGRYFAQSIKPFSLVKEKVNLFIDVYGSVGGLPFALDSSGYMSDDLIFTPFSTARLLQNTFSEVGAEPQSASGSPWAKVAWAPNYSTASLFRANYSTLDPPSRIKADFIIQPDDTQYYIYPETQAWLASGYHIAWEFSYLTFTLKKSAQEIRTGNYMSNLALTRNSGYASHNFALNHAPGIPVNITGQTIAMKVYLDNTSGPLVFTTGCNIVSPASSGRINFILSSGYTNILTSGTYAMSFTATSGVTATVHYSGYIYPVGTGVAGGFSP